MHERRSNEPTLQTPPEVKIAFKDNAATQVKLVCVGNTVPGRTTYKNDMEYFYYKSSSPSFDNLTSMESAILDTTDADITRWIDNYTSAFSHSRTTYTWTWGQRQTRGRTGYLYSMDDPDSTANPTPKIGVLFEVDASNVLQAVVFYRNSGAISIPSSGIWTKTGAFSLELTKLTSVDPRNLMTTDTAFWYRTLMGTQ